MIKKTLYKTLEMFPSWPFDSKCKKVLFLPFFYINNIIKLNNHVTRVIMASQYEIAKILWNSTVCVQIKDKVSYFAPKCLFGDILWIILYQYYLLNLLRKRNIIFYSFRSHGSDIYCFISIQRTGFFLHFFYLFHLYVVIIIHS